jgi:hypothetical protein
MQDSKELASLFDRDTNERTLNVYNDRQYTYIVDTNSSNNMLFFDNQSLMNGLYSVEDAFITLPLQIEIPTKANYNNGVALSVADSLNFALKQGTAGLIAGVQMQLADGQTIIQELDACPHINAIRRKFEFNELGLKSRATETQYAPDTFPYLPGASINSYGLGNSGSIDGSQKLIRLPTNGGKQLSTKPFLGGRYKVTACAANVVTIGGNLGVTRDWYVGMPISFEVIGTGAIGTATVYTGYYINTITGDGTFTISAAPGTGTTQVITCATFTDPNIVFAVVPVHANPYYNEGFHRRIQMRKAFTKDAIATTMVTPADAANNIVFILNAIIPLRDIHDIFKQWTFPTTNVRWQMRLSLAYPMNTSSAYNPFQHDGSIAEADEQKITVSYAKGNARLYMKQITLTPEQNTKLNSLLTTKEGFAKHLVYAETQAYPLNQSGPWNTASQGSWTITNSITGVKRMIIYALPLADASNSQDGFTVGRASRTGLQSWSIPANPTILLKQCELKVNNVPLEKYRNETERELFQSLKEQTHNAGESNTNNSLISYRTVLQGNSYYYVFDFQRLGIRPSENVPIQLQVTATAVDSTVNANIFAVIEREAHVDLYVDTNSARVVKDYL